MLLKLPWPIEGGAILHPVTRTAQEHLDSKESLAVDFGRPSVAGDVCIANFDGTVTFAGYDPGPAATSAGYFVEVRGPVEGDTLTAAWCHLAGEPDVHTGQVVRAGDRLGALGYTGWVIPPGPAGAHLHYRLSIGGERVDPELYLSDTLPAEEAMTDAERTAIVDGLNVVWDRLDRIQAAARGETTESLESLAEEGKQLGVVPIKVATGLQ